MITVRQHYGLFMIVINGDTMAYTGEKTHEFDRISRHFLNLEISKADILKWSL